MAQVNHYVSSKALQFFFVPEREHWVATTYTDGEVRLYDSKFTGRSTLSIYYIEAWNNRSVRCTETLWSCNGNLLVTVAAVQQQTGASECGVMAIANGYHAICGNNLATMTFKQEEMRNHLSRCLEDTQFSPFPVHVSEVPACQMTSTLKYINIEVNCFCGRPDSHQDMIGCDGCDKWYHLNCTELSDSVPDGDWFCSKCS